MLVVGIAVGGVMLGVAARVTAHMPGPFEFAFALGMPWLLVSFAVGFAVRELAAGALDGAAVLIVSVLAYYAVVALVERRSGPHYAAGMTVLWGFFGALSGALFGLAGAAATRDSARIRMLGLALVAGALIGEGALYLRLGHGGGIERTLLTAEVLLGMGLPLMAVRPARLVPAAVALTAGFSAVALVADEAIRVFARAYGWGA